MQADFIPRRHLLAHLEQGWSLIPNMDYRPGDWAILMAAPIEGVVLQADTAAIMRYFNPPLLKMSNVGRATEIMGKREYVYNRPRKCRKGHDYTEENTRITPRGRRCRACERRRMKAQYKRFKAVQA